MIPTLSVIVLLAGLLWLLAADGRAADLRPEAKQSWQWRYRVWLPPHWQRLAQCESGSKPPNWRHDSGTYQGAFGFHRDTWDDRRYRPRAWTRFPADAHLATPWQQWRVALRVAARWGMAEPWGCWRGPDHAWVRGGLPEHGTYA